MSVEKETFKLEKRFQTCKSRGWWFTTPHHATHPFEQFISPYIPLEDISMKLGPNLVLKFFAIIS